MKDLYKKLSVYLTGLNLSNEGLFYKKLSVYLTGLNLSIYI
jgi:hypothetical protein